MVATRVPRPAGSYLREESVVIHSGPDSPGRTLELGMAQPSATDDGWWLGLLWAADDEGVVNARDVAPLAGPPPGPPLLTLGPLFTGALAGFIAEEGGRQAVRLRLPPAEDESRPWDRPLLLQVALRWEPLRAATMSSNQLAREALRAFGRAVAAAGRPG
jgi:hypothetical protein